MDVSLQIPTFAESDFVSSNIANRETASTSAGVSTAPPAVINSTLNSIYDFVKSITLSAVALIGIAIGSALPDSKLDCAFFGRAITYLALL